MKKCPRRGMDFRGLAIVVGFIGILMRQAKRSLRRMKVCILTGWFFCIYPFGLFLLTVYLF